MDRYALNALLGVIGTTFLGLIGFSFTRLGKALATRLEGGDARLLEERLSRVEAELDRTRQDLAEAHERLEFTERVLARVEQATVLPLPGGDDSPRS